MDMNAVPFWNETLETISRERLEKVQLARFRNILSYAYQHSQAYRELYQRHGVTPESIKTISDVSKVPIVDKNFFYDSGQALAYGKTLAVPASEVAFFHQTSGTTSTPLPQPDTYFDWQFHAECWAQALWAQGVRAADKVLIAFHYNLFIGFWQCHYGCEKIGAEIIPTGGLSTEIRLQKIRDLGVTVVVTTPSYAFRLAECAEKNGYDLAGSTVGKIILSGEPGALVEGVKEKIGKTWNADVYDVIGATEVGTWGFECQEHPGGLHILESDFYPELIGLEDGKLITGPGEYGKLVLTNFFRRGRPCIRFDTKDIACWAEGGCPCGRSFRLLKGGVQGRTDHLLKVRGTFFNPATVEDIVARDGRCSHEYRIVLQKDNYSIELQAEAAKGIEEASFAEIAADIGKKISNAAFLRLTVKILPYGSLERSDAKTKRVVDLREKRR